MMQHARLWTAPLALLLEALLICQPIPAPPPASAAPVLDYDIPGGRFYTQGNGYPLGTSPKGFSVVDNASARLFGEYSRLGGLADLGPPISRRFDLNGAPAITLKIGVLVWRSSEDRALFLAVMDMLSEAGKDDWLLRNHGIPRPAERTADAATRQDWLRAQPAFFQFFLSLQEPASILGLPTSRVEDTGQAFVMRFQRGALRQDKTDSGAAGDVTLVETGEIARAAGLLAKASFSPENPPATAPDWSGYAMKGKATWYGKEFHGKPMANGAPFNMNDPTITACNAYPLGTRLKVTNRNGASVEVRVTDTGGFTYPYVVDLSWAAFKLLAEPSESQIDVTVEVLSPP